MYHDPPIPWGAPRWSWRMVCGASSRKWRRCRVDVKTSNSVVKIGVYISLVFRLSLSYGLYWSIEIIIPMWDDYLPFDPYIFSISTFSSPIFWFQVVKICPRFGRTCPSFQDQAGDGGYGAGRDSGCSERYLTTWEKKVDWFIATWLPGNICWDVGSYTMCNLCVYLILLGCWMAPMENLEAETCGRWWEWIQRVVLPLPIWLWINTY